MAFTNFSDLWSFLGSLTIFLLFDDLLTDLSPAPVSTPSNSITIWATLVDESVDKLFWVLRWSESQMNTWISCTDFGVGQSLPGWAERTLESKPSPAGINTLTRSVEPQSKATSTGYWSSASDAQSKTTVFADGQCPEHQRVIWFLVSFKHLAGIVTGTFLAPETESQRLFIIISQAAVAHSLVLKSSNHLIVESKTPSSICFFRKFSSDGMYR